MLIHNPKDLADLSVTARKKKKLSQTQVGATVGLKQNTISKFELRPESTQLDTLFRILAALDLEVQVFAKKNPHSPNAEKKWQEEW